MKLVSFLYQFARTVNTLTKLSSPDKTVRRIKNIIIGRGLARVGFWKKLW